MCQGWTGRAWVVSGLYELLSRMDVYFQAATLDLLTSSGDRFLQDKDRDGGRRLVLKKKKKKERQSRYRQRKISSVNRAWLTAGYV